MIEVKNLKIPSGCSAFGFWSFAHDGGSICDINNIEHYPLKQIECLICEGKYEANRRIQ